MIGQKYFTSNLTCNNGVIDTGCVCLTKGSKKLLGNRGYISKLPYSNGLLEEDNRISAFKIMEDQIPRPMNILGQTTELTGSPMDTINTIGRYENKYDNKIDKYKTVKSEEELVKRYSIPVNNNIITYDNQAINDTLLKLNKFGNVTDDSSEVNKLLARQIGFDSKDFIVDRK
jgi:hypothetical protein